MGKIQENDIIFDGKAFYKVLYICYITNTIDLKCYNQPTTIRAFPIEDLKNIEIIKEIPKNITFLRK